MSPKRQYVTTAIDYPNAAPHMGHVLEKVLADVTVRWMRLRGDHVRFQIGTDEHGIKIQQTAEKQGMTPHQLVEQNVPLFQKLYDQLEISYDVFIRTTDQKKHWPTVIELWKKLREAGALEKRTYTGLYCTGCERFLTKKDLVDGKCPIHLTVPEEVKEENWFFLLAREGTWLKKLLTDDYKIVPEFRAPETFALIDQGLDDVSFSRPTSSLSWGVPVPEDTDQTMYVWCDALTNYISGLGYFTDHAEKDWWDTATVTHVIGKDIARFHALIWPAMLKQADVRTPDRLLIHGFLTSEGQKMSKSLGNVVVPQDVIDKYGIEPLRFYLSHEIPVGNDGDFSWKRFAELYDAKLRNQLGNLLNRVLVLLKKEGGSIDVPEEPMLVTNHWTMYEKHMNAFAYSEALAEVFLFAAECNKFMDDQKPWTLSGKPRLDALSALAESLRHISLMLLPFMPETSVSISLQLNVPDADQLTDRSFVLRDTHRRWGGIKSWKGVGEPQILFKPIL
jgi:methionyl-tRNA synthetase